MYPVYTFAKRRGEVTWADNEHGLRSVNSNGGENVKETTSSKNSWKGKEAEVKTEYGWYTSPHLWEQLKPLAREMRRAPTSSEDRLWQRLRNHQLRGFKFRRQHTIDRFIVDIYCSNVRLVIEVDGPVHQYTPEEDVIRQRVLRFTNEQVETNVESVLAEIGSALERGR